MIKWIHQVYFERKRGGTSAYIEEPKIFKNQKALEPILKEGAEIYINARNKGKMELFDAWLDGKPELGVIGEGVYLPEFILSPRAKADLSYEGEATLISLSPHGHFESRGTIKETFGTINLAESAVKPFRHKHIANRIHAYINHVYNVVYVEPQIHKLDKLVRIFGEDFAKAKPMGLARLTQEAKGHSLLDYMKLYAHRMKDYPVLTGPLGEFMKFTQSAFFRALTPRPSLWLRNIPQRVVTVQHKEFVTDAKYWSSKYRFKNLPQDVLKRYIEGGVDQEEAFDHHYLQLQATEKYKQWPIVGPVLTLAEKVGHVYSVTDRSNRQFVFSKVWFRTGDMYDKYIAGQLNKNQLEARLGLQKLDPYNYQKMWYNIQIKNKAELQFQLAKYMTDNSQWMYRRTEKSLAEMTGEGESWTNLLTWSKSVFQQVVGAAENIERGFEIITKGKPSHRATGAKMMLRGGEVIGSLMIAGIIATKALEHITLQHKGKFASYGPDMFIWEFGGVTAEILRTFTDNFSEVITSLDGTKEEQDAAMEKLVKGTDNMFFRQLIPFSKQALAMVEAITGRSYIQPLYEKFTKIRYGYSKQQTYVDRTTIEGIVHAILATDPNKQEVVRKWANRKMYEFETRVAQGGSEPMSTWNKMMYNRYRYLNDMFQRYKPIELFKDRINKEYEKMYNAYSDPNKAYYDALYKSTAPIYKAQRIPQYYK